MDALLSNETLLQAVNEFGSPLYVYDEQRIRDQYGKLVGAFHRSDVLIFYACKALTNVNILRIMHELGAGIDCVSINEVRMALTAGVEPGAMVVPG